VYKEITAKVHKEAPAGTYFIVLAPGESLTDEMKKLSDDGLLRGELRIDDGRTISAKQRKKAWATLRDISLHNGDDQETNHWYLKHMFMTAKNATYFSLADCSVTAARHYISFLLDFCLEWGIPLTEPLISRTDDINAALYSALMHKRCIVCGGDAHLHHAEDRVGMGRNRKEIIHLGMRVMALCPTHHDECHRIGQDTFNSRYHVCGISAAEEMCKVWGLKFSE